MNLEDITTGLHFMLDLETLSINSSNAYITEIGIVAVNMQEDTSESCQMIIDPTYLIDPPYKDKLGELQADRETIKWWFNHNPERIRHWLDVGREPLEVSVSAERWIRKKIKDFDGEYFVWSSPSFFDVNIMQNFWNVFDRECPWEHYNIYDLRTLRLIGDMFGINYESEEKDHYALSDALQQMDELTYRLRILKHIQEQYEQAGNNRGRT